MKKRILAILGVTIVIIGYTTLSTNANLYSNGTGAPGPQTCTGCHFGSNLSDASVHITISKNGTPVTEYVAGQVYDVAVGMTKSAITKFGFALSANGGILNTDPTSTKVQKISSYITHTSNGTIPSTAGTPEWTCKWTAPTNGTVAFQLYVNASNSDANNSGDLIYSKSLSISKSTTAGVEDVISNDHFNIYPNPVKDQINLEYTLRQKATITIKLIAINGEEMEILFKGEPESGIHKISLSFEKAYAKGTYLIKIETGSEVKYQKIFIQ